MRLVLRALRYIEGDCSQWSYVLRIEVNKRKMARVRVEYQFHEPLELSAVDMPTTRE